MFISLDRALHFWLKKRIMIFYSARRLGDSLPWDEQKKFSVIKNLPMDGRTFVIFYRSIQKKEKVQVEI